MINLINTIAGREYLLANYQWCIIVALLLAMIIINFVKFRKLQKLTITERKILQNLFFEYLFGTIENSMFVSIERTLNNLPDRIVKSYNNALSLEFAAKLK